MRISNFKAAKRLPKIGLAIGYTELSRLATPNIEFIGGRKTSGIVVTILWVFIVVEFTR
jgi:hypothetical protein